MSELRAAWGTDSCGMLGERAAESGPRTACRRRCSAPHRAARHRSPTTPGAEMTRAAMKGKQHEAQG